jgi:riboflavin synthase
MFTGIVEKVGVVRSIATTPTGRKISIEAGTVADGMNPGDSISVNGVCVTVIELVSSESATRVDELVADILQKTWEVTNLSTLGPGSKVNLERALRMGGRIGGHFVLGHVDGQGIVESREIRGGDLVLGISVNAELEGGLVPRGSVAVDGVSLTIARLLRGIFYVHLIPFTRNSTSLGSASVGSCVNIELDILGKYAGREAPEAITREYLRAKGFL